MKKILILLLGMGFAAGLSAQELANVFLTQTGKPSFRINVEGISVFLSEKGKIVEIRTDSYGTVVYNTDKRVEQVGSVKIQFNYKNWVSQIGQSSVLYDYEGRVDRIGNLSIGYHHNGMVGKFGNQALQYNANKSLDRFDAFQVVYNYQGQVQKIDASNGLIVLQLNYQQ